MWHRIKAGIARRIPHFSVAYARTREIFSRSKLPPGNSVRLNELENKDRRVILRQAAQFGPIFKATPWGEFWVYVVGLPLGRRLLREHAASLRPVTAKLDSLFPKGLLRQMQGEDHRKYRKALVRAIRADDYAANQSQLEAIAARGLADYAADQATHHNSAEAYIAALNAIASGMLIQVFFGAQFGTAEYERLMQGYRKLGPGGFVWHIGQAQTDAFAEIRDFLLAHFTGQTGRPPPSAAPSILGRVISEGLLDATLLGNLIYMVEMGRFDTYSLFRWLTKYAADHPDLLARIRAEDPAATRKERSLTEAFVLETLRTDQSERLIRRVLHDIVFEGHLIPKHAHVRVCMWEAHKSEAAFPEPFRFDPERFLGSEPTSNEYSPFGLDHHQCPLGDVAIQTSMIFLRALARGYTLTPSGDGLPVHGAFHWEPASEFAVTLQPRPPGT